MMNDPRMTKAMFGQHAVHVPAWIWIQNQGPGANGEQTVILAGASKVPAAPHPARFGSEATHQFMLGEVILRPHLVFETDYYQGYGVTGLLTAGVDVNTLVKHGKLLADPMGLLKGLL